MKTCSICRTDKDDSAFYKRADGRLLPACAQCCKDKSASRYKNDPEYRKSNKIRFSKLTPDQRKNYDLRHRYGITIEDYNRILTEQGGSCALCKTTDFGKKGVLNVDHCHQTGRVRGLLCNECNIGLGKFKDSTQLLQVAIDYLEKN